MTPTNSRSRLARVALVVLVVAVALAGTPSAFGAEGYALDSPSVVDVPNGVVSGGGELFTVREIARVPSGEPFELRTTAPASTEYEVELRDMSGMVVDVSSRTLRGEDSTSFPTDSLRPGSYVAVLSHRGEARAVLPVVIEGYAVSVDAPETVEADAEATVSATLSPASNTRRAGAVELAVVERSSGDVLIQRDMNASGDGYSATVRLAEPGEHLIYVDVRGERSMWGHREVLGFSDPLTLSVTAPSSSTDEVTSDAAASGGSGTATRTPAASPATTASTTVPEGVITRNASADRTTTVADPPTSVLSMVFVFLLAAGLGLLYWVRI